MATSGRGRERGRDAYVVRQLGVNPDAGVRCRRLAEGRRVVERAVGFELEPRPGRDHTPARAPHARWRHAWRPDSNPWVWEPVVVEPEAKRMYAEAPSGAAAGPSSPEPPEPVGRWVVRAPPLRWPTRRLECDRPFAIAFGPGMPTGRFTRGRAVFRSVPAPGLGHRVDFRTRTNEEYLRGGSPSPCTICPTAEIIASVSLRNEGAFAPPAEHRQLDFNMLRGVADMPVYFVFEGEGPGGDELPEGPVAFRQVYFEPQMLAENVPGLPARCWIPRYSLAPGGSPETCPRPAYLFYGDHLGGAGRLAVGDDGAPLGVGAPLG